jgi:ribonucleotide monophosphatase NagD (HAD superfamily)
VQGFAPEVGWAQLAEAAYALALPEEEGGIPWIATNTDWTIPQSRGVAPGNGTLVSAVHTAIGRLATVAGKPEVPIFDEAVARFGARHPLFLGDRLDTDILGANRAGIPSALVLTGIDRPKHVLAAPAGSQPTFILGDLRELHEPYPDVQIADGSASVRGATVRIDGPDVRIVSAGDPIDLLRAGAAAIWATGRAIFGFRVPEALYADPFHRP